MTKEADYVDKKMSILDSSPIVTILKVYTMSSEVFIWSILIISRKQVWTRNFTKLFPQFTQFKCITVPTVFFGKVMNKI